jgi:hypothetical protein
MIIKGQKGRFVADRGQGRDARVLGVAGLKVLPLLRRGFERRKLTVRPRGHAPSRAPAHALEVMVVKYAHLCGRATKARETQKESERRERDLPQA